ncbi:MAG: hypothetical protein E7376_04675 [Clostridiales bacterium]|nr:hypothetical protein [Clostridiales bacterium]
MKKLKTTSIVLFIIACVIEVACVITCIDCIRLLTSESLDALAIIALLPLFFIGTFILLIISVSLTIIYKKICEKSVQSDMQQPKFYKLHNIVSWLFLVINIALFVALYFV